MWKTILTVLVNVFGLARDLEDNRKEIKELNEKLYKLAGLVQKLSDRIDANIEIGEVERKALVLQVQNEFLKANQSTSPLLTVASPKNGGKKTSRRQRAPQ
jgi:hypothetical protein